MQVTDPTLHSYLRHRLGEHRIIEQERMIRQKALQLNTPGVDFSATFGHGAIPAYVGFVDLAGFSTAVNGMTPDQIAEYLEPFLGRLIAIVRGRHALIDKTIGDEVMFVLPVTEEENNPETLFLGQLMGGLHDLAFELKNYPFRIGLSYGAVRFFCIEGSGYSEWTAVGETIHVAKRLHGLQELEKPAPVVGAFGMQVRVDSVDEIRKVMRQQLGIFAGHASRFDHTLVNTPIKLKGVGEVLYAILTPRPERVPKTPN